MSATSSSLSSTTPAGMASLIKKHGTNTALSVNSLSGRHNKIAVVWCCAVDKLTHSAGQDQSSKSRR